MSSTSSTDSLPETVSPIKQEPYTMRDRQNSYKDLSVVRKISNSKFPVYLTSSQTTQQNYAMKVFSYDGDCLHSYYKNEIRFASLKHPNIVNMLYYQNEKHTIRKGQLQKISYLLMEYAPYGDFFQFISKYERRIDEKLTRTYFRQLIDGIEYLHENGVAHLDIKPENLLIDADFNLKITDFDLSYMSGDWNVLSRGTRFYRGPEFYRFLSSSSSDFLQLEDPFAADIYSAGILLFILKSGAYPHSEDFFTGGVCLGDLMYQNNEEFWDKHCEIQGKNSSFFGSDFKELYNGMVKFNPKERLTLQQIKESRWYNGPVYSPRELSNKMKDILLY